MYRHVIRPLALFAVACVAVAAGTASTASGPDPEVRELYDRGREAYAPIESYVARLTRRETADGEQRPEEVILFKFRKEPWSAYLKWVGDAGTGREGLYVPGRHGGKVHVRVAAWDIPFVPAGRRMALDPDGSLLRAASPHPITDLGVGALLDKLGAVLDAQEGGDDRRGTLRVVGPEDLPEFAEPAYGIEHAIPAGADPALPAGGRRVYWFDPATGLPAVARTRGPAGGEVDYYRYDRLQHPVGLDDADFDPDVLWGVQADPS